MIPESRHSTKLSFQSSELGPTPLHTQASVYPPPLASGGGGAHSLAGEGVGRDGPNSDERTDTVIL
jgi:hypothetical protein